MRKLGPAPAQPIFFSKDGQKIECAGIGPTIFLINNPNPNSNSQLRADNEMIEFIDFYMYLWLQNRGCKFCECYQGQGQQPVHLEWCEC